MNTRVDRNTHRKAGQSYEVNVEDFNLKMQVNTELRSAGTRADGMTKSVSPPTDSRRFAFVLAGVLIAFLVALILGALLNTPPLAQTVFSTRSVFIGVIATLPPLAFSFWLATTSNTVFTRIRNAQLELFSNIGFALTAPRIILLAFAAGIGEEFLFRGVFQTWLDGFAPIWAAIIAPNIVFGLLHAHNAFYAVAAGVIGIYFGIIFYATGDLAAPVLTHALYDLGALDLTRRAMRNFRPQAWRGD